MQKSGPSDPELLAEWLEQRRESAFHVLVSRYAGLVLMTAKRTCGNDSMAAEASQLTFILLARKASSLLTCASLGGWLHRAALMHAKNLLRTARRESHKRQSLQDAMETFTPQPGDLWKDLQPVLDESLAALSVTDREAILLRFYRSLSVREVAGTLGIATDAAQKRIDRATARLRNQLTRRGCQTGGSLAGVMLAGFATDVQAAAPLATALASDALAAGAGAAPASGFLTAVTTKTTSIVTPLVILFAAGAWLVSQRQSIARVEWQSATLQQHLASVPSLASTSKTAVKSIWDRKPIDWEEIANQLNNGEGAGGYLRSTMRIEEGFLAMSRGELISSLDEVEAAKLSERNRVTLVNRLTPPLREKDPEYVTKRYISALALGKWASRDPEQALAWFDAQLAAGTFKGTTASGIEILKEMVHELTFSLISIDPASVNRVLAILPESQRIQALHFGANRMKKEDHAAWADLFRTQLPDKDRLGVVTWPVSELGEIGTLGYAEVSDYLKRINAAPDERRACILDFAANKRFPRSSGNFFKPSLEDLDALRDWVGTEEAELVNPATAAALKGLLSVCAYPPVAHFALHYHQTGAGDEVLIPLLENHRAREHRDLARRLAKKLSNKQRREEFLKQLDKLPPGP